LLRPLGAVLRAALSTVRYAHRVEDPTNNVITNSGEILYTTAANEHHGVLLEVVPLTGNVRGDLHTVGQTYTSYLTKGRIRLLRSSCVHANADATLLRTGLKRR
jgi:hypothetical protein